MLIWYEDTQDGSESRRSNSECDILTLFPLFLHPLTKTAKVSIKSGMPTQSATKWASRQYFIDNPASLSLQCPIAVNLQLEIFSGLEDFVTLTLISSSA